MSKAKKAELDRAQKVAIVIDHLRYPFSEITDEIFRDDPAEGDDPVAAAKQVPLLLARALHKVEFILAK